MLHICRDFLARHPTSTTVFTRYYGLYISAMFLNGVLGYTQVGHTNFNLSSGSITKGFGTNTANINLGLGYERAVQLPSGSYVVSASDVGRVLALKSNNNPRLSSGLFRISGIDSSSNAVFVEARGWLDAPPVESSVSWTMYETESTVTANFANGANSLAAGQYRGNGNATTSRIILQSPHSTAWQLRIAAETTLDVGATGINAPCGAPCSFTPGFGGDSSGDFPQVGRHLHHPIFFNVTSAITADPVRTHSTLPGFPAFTSDEPGRYYMWGDDSTGSAFLFCRQHGDTGADGLVVFGLAEDEQLPLPTDAVHRLFSFGAVKTGVHDVSIDPDHHGSGGQLGVAFGLGMQPIMCVPSSWCYLAGNASQSGIMNDSVAADSVYLKSTELYGWDLVAGTYDVTIVTAAPNISLEPRRLGRLPFARKGRENFNNYSTSTDVGQTYMHLARGIYLPWSGSIIP